MKVLALVYPGMTLLDLVGPLQAWSFLPGYEVQYAWHRPGPVLTDCGLSVQATNSFEDAWTDPDVLIVTGGAPTADKPEVDIRYGAFINLVIAFIVTVPVKRATIG